MMQIEIDLFVIEIIFSSLKSTCRMQPGAEMAFVQVAAGAFQMRACQVVDPLVEEGQDIRPSESGQTGEVVISATQVAPQARA